MKKYLTAKEFAEKAGVTRSALGKAKKLQSYIKRNEFGYMQIDIDGLNLYPGAPYWKEMEQSHSSKCKDQLMLENVEETNVDTSIEVNQMRCVSPKEYIVRAKNSNTKIKLTPLQPHHDH